MDLMDKVLGTSSGQSSTDDYVDIDESDLSGDGPMAAGQTLYTADIRGKEDIMNIKDALYDGHIVIADITHLESNGIPIDRVVGQLRRVIEEVGGDIVQKSDEQLLLTPSGIGISRERL